MAEDMEGRGATEGSRQESEQAAAVAKQHIAKPMVLWPTGTKRAEGSVQICWGPSPQVQVLSSELLDRLPKVY